MLVIYILPVHTHFRPFRRYIFRTQRKVCVFTKKLHTVVVCGFFYSIALTHGVYSIVNYCHCHNLWIIGHFRILVTGWCSNYISSQGSKRCGVNVNEETSVSERCSSTISDDQSPNTSLLNYQANKLK